MPNAVALQQAVKACNDTAGMNGLVLTLLVLGSVPRILVQPQELSVQRERMNMLRNARAHMNELIT